MKQGDLSFIMKSWKKCYSNGLNQLEWVLTLSEMHGINHCGTQFAFIITKVRERGIV